MRPRVGLLAPLLIVACSLSSEDVRYPGASDAGHDADASSDAAGTGGMAGAGGLSGAGGLAGSGAAGVGGGPDAAADSDVDAAPDATVDGAAEAGAPDADAASDAKADAGNDPCVPPSVAPCGSWACGFNCSTSCPTPWGYVEPSGSGARCPAPPAGGKCTNTLPLWSVSGDHQAVILPAAACSLEYLVEVADKQCVRIRTSTPDWGGCKVASYVKPSGTSPDRIVVKVTGPGPMVAGWVNVEWSALGSNCPLACP